MKTRTILDFPPDELQRLAALLEESAEYLDDLYPSPDAGTSIEAIYGCVETVTECARLLRVTAEKKTHTGLAIWADHGLNPTQPPE